LPDGIANPEIKIIAMGTNPLVLGFNEYIFGRKF
jgi:hypothetical protein